MVTEVTEEPLETYRAMQKDGRSVGGGLVVFVGNVPSFLINRYPKLALADADAVAPAKVLPPSQINSPEFTLMERPVPGEHSMPLTLPDSSDILKPSPILEFVELTPAFNAKKLALSLSITEYGPMPVMNVYTLYGVSKKEECAGSALKSSSPVHHYLLN